MRCPTCGGRITAKDAACPICGAQILRPPTLRIIISRIFLSGLIILSLIIGMAWLIKPTVSLSGTPTTTLTCTPWPTQTYTDTSTPTMTPSTTPTATPTPFCVLHAVEASEDLQIISEKFQVPMADIQRRNRLEENAVLRPGQELCIPISPEAVLSLTPPPTGTPTPFIYAVQKGDNLGSIAQKFGSTVELIVKANNLSGTEMLQIGQKLTIIRLLDTPTPSSTPTSRGTPTPWPPTVTPTATETPAAFAYPPPALLSPASGAIFHGEDAQIVLNWTAVNLLAPEEWYILHLSCIKEGQTRSIANVWTKGTSWRVPHFVYANVKSGHHLFQWDVLVARKSQADESVAISPPSEASFFYWY